MRFFAPKFEAASLKSNLKLAIQRLQLLQRKKRELNTKARKEIAEYIKTDKIDRARIKVEQIIREDYVIEAYENLEYLCDFLISRISVLMTQSNIDESLSESVSTLIWVIPRIGYEIPELHNIGNQFMIKFGRHFFDGAQSNCLRLVSQKIISCFSVEPPTIQLVDKYLQAISDSYNLPFEPRPYEESTKKAKDFENQLVDEYEREQQNNPEETKVITTTDFYNDDDEKDPKRVLIGELSKTQSDKKKLRPESPINFDVHEKTVFLNKNTEKNQSEEEINETYIISPFSNVLSPTDQENVPVGNYEFTELLALNYSEDEGSKESPQNEHSVSFGVTEEQDSLTKDVSGNKITNQSERYSDFRLD